MVWSGQYKRATGRLPAWYHRRPQHYPGDEFYMEAFDLLGTERRLVAGVIAPIPWSKAIHYAQECGFDRPTRLWFARLMVYLDRIWRAHMREEEDKKAKRDAKRAAIEAKLAKNKNPQAGRPTRRLRKGRSR